MLGGPDGSGDWGRCDPNEPRNRRSRSSALIESEDGRALLVDAGPDLRQQLLASRVQRVDALVVTHGHADHIMGLDEFRPLNRIMGRAIPAFGTSDTLDELRRRFDYVFLEPTPPAFYRPALTQQAIEPSGVWEMAGFPVQVFIQDHKVMETLGLRIGAFAYSTDVVAMPEDSFAQLEGLDTWVVGCFQRKPHPVHAHLDLVMSWVERLKPRRTVLTHMGTDLDWAWMREHLPEGIEAAHDGLVLNVPG
ncbi:MBL fold metallo-hydrolase [Roseomonas marmotae]|uniref:MBL fold metallo-hydrolase n=1 Tax=Roseomonas marmotae TaxID=2768161 RepID=A0ABS3KEC1_9PROT|nr:MBL fold metallo-hydrolase [Roseomonas marmotae]MBO1075290.1 MBL fold metallo-hydrolase [Roseomonas marmotae]QTI78271.1 MBL fold metallo-hydrolase [Roseomonas marmotae]